tara:strand:+ start:114 stop:506 length:393 start_codon:yes stop_codon:yes gene_type:complete
MKNILLILFVFLLVGCDDYPSHYNTLRVDAIDTDKKSAESGPKFKIGELVKWSHTGEHGAIDKYEKGRNNTVYYYVKLFDVEKKEYIMERFSKLRTSYITRIDIEYMKDIWAEAGMEKVDYGASVSQAIE